MPARKRGAAEAQLDLPSEPAIAPELQDTLHKLRNMWEFASLMQFIFLFGAVVKIDEDFDIDVGTHETSPAVVTWALEIWFRIVLNKADGILMCRTSKWNACSPDRPTSLQILVSDYSSTFRRTNPLEQYRL
jgi:hypothetical protein